MTKRIILSLILTIVMMSFAGCGTGNSSASTNNSNDKKQEAKDTKNSADEKPIYKVLNNVGELQGNFNKFAQGFGLDFKITKTDTQPGEIQDIFQYMFNQNIGISCAINKKDKSIRNIAMIGNGDGTTQSAANIFLVMGTLIATVDSSLSKDERGQIIKELGLPDELADGLNKTTVHNNIKYSVSFSKDTGLVFTINSALDK